MNERKIRLKSNLIKITHSKMMKDNSNSDLIPKIILSSTVTLYRKGNLYAIIKFGFTNVNDREPYKYFKQRSQGL